MDVNTAALKHNKLYKYIQLQNITFYSRSNNFFSNTLSCINNFQTFTITCAWSAKDVKNGVNSLLSQTNPPEREAILQLYSSFTVWFKLDWPQSHLNHLTELWVNLNELQNSNNSIGLMYGKTVTDN